MKVLQLFSGSGILSKTFKERGHTVFTVYELFISMGSKEINWILQKK